MKKLITKNKDTVYHLVAGVLLSLLLGGGILGLAFAILVGILKEIFDIKRTGFNAMDGLATAIGGAIPLLVQLLI